MVLWEITLATAYFLGLKRTYRLALKTQRRLISPKHPKIRKFVHGKTRAVFDVALKVHQNIQNKDIEVGRSLGNWILRCLDKIKPSAQIRIPPTDPPPPGTSNTNTTTRKQLNQKTREGFQRFGSKGDKDSGRHLFSSARNVWAKPFPTIGMMMKPAKPIGGTNNTRNRYLSFSCLEAGGLRQRKGGFEGVLRRDIMQWMLQK